MAVSSLDRRALLLASVVAISLSFSTVATLGVGGAAPTVTAVSYDGDAGIDVDGEAQYVWASGEHRFAVDLEGLNGSAAYEVCLRTDGGSDGGGRALGCRTSDGGGSARTVELERTDWPEETAGPQTVEAVVRRANESSVVATGELRVRVIRRDGDLDGDDLANEEEVQLGTDLMAADTDGDGLEDGAEVEAGTDPLAADTDGDELDDGRELAAGTNPNRADTDGDGLDDHAELTVYDTDPTAADTDDDGLADSTEVQDEQTDPTAADTDGDGLADGDEVNVHGTDPNTVDTDGDGLTDREEVEEHQTDPTAADTDDDGLQDGAEVNSYDTDPNNADTDGDGLEDGAEIDRGTNPRAVNTEAGGSGPVTVDGQLPDWVWTAALGVGAVAVAAVALLWRSGTPAVVRRWRADDSAAPEAASVETGDAAADEATAGAAAAVQGGGRATAMTDEERVLQLLDREDGRMRQSRIVEATGWSKAKVSKVLARMDDADQVVKVSTGRENLIARPGDEPEFVRSSLDESSGE
jgi:hypothetical protein